MKVFVDAKRHHAEFKTGDMVYLKLWPYRQCSLARYKFEKLAARYYGPYKILQRIGSIACKLSNFHPRRPFTRCSMSPNYDKLGALHYLHPTFLPSCQRTWR